MHKNHVRSIVLKLAITKDSDEVNVWGHGD